ncbi:rhamnulokinase [bacterium Unc6]|nr:rhamnulokinase [bacterium Unc6]
MSTYVAFDLGAESGRTIVANLKDSKVHLEEVSRFSNIPAMLPDGLHWNVLGLFLEMKNSLKSVVKKTKGNIYGLGIDTWGVDFGLIGKNDVLLSSPYHYRDLKTQGMIEEALKFVSKERFYEKTGIQFMRINTVFQLLSMVKNNPCLLENAETMLMMPSLFRFLLTGEKKEEFTIATTSQMFNPVKNNWETEIIEKLKIPVRILPPVVRPGLHSSKLLPYISEELKVKDIPVITTAGHDTACAVAAVPAQGNNWAYISSGTWSLLGVEIKQPILTQKALFYNITNEGGFADTYRFLKNIMGMWLIQQCRKIWEKKGMTYTYPQLTKMAKLAKPFQMFIDPNNKEFIAPKDMTLQIQEFCQHTGQKFVKDISSITRCCLESLALTYRATIEQIEELVDKNIEVIHIVGGGSQNELLSQFTANATNRIVLSGPVEATAVGNILIQAYQTKQVQSIEHLRTIVRKSFPIQEYKPKDADSWNEAYIRYKKIISSIF